MSREIKDYEQKNKQLNAYRENHETPLKHALIYGTERQTIQSCELCNKISFSAAESFKFWGIMMLESHKLIRLLTIKLFIGSNYHYIVLLKNNKK